MGTRLALVAAIVLGIAAALGVRTWIEQEKEQARQEYDPVRIVVAGRNLRKGEVLKTSMMKTKLVAKELLVAGMISEDEATLYANRILKDNLLRGEPLFKHMLEVPTEKFQTLKSVVREGRRAITLRVDQVTGVAGMIRPGDYVDITATYAVSDDAGVASGRPGERQTKTIFLLQAVRILAVDDRTLTASARGRSTSGYRTVTVEVDPWDALRLVNAQAQASLQLMLRSPADVSVMPDEYEGRLIHWDTTAEARETVNYTDVPRAAPEEAEDAPEDGAYPPRRRQ